MADHTNIEWTEATWNPITGCSVKSPGCTNCYAMKLAGTRLQHHPSRVGLTVDSKAGSVWTGEVRFNEQWLDQPLRWKRPRMIFVCAHGDLFHESVPDKWIDRVFAVMALAPQHTFQVLTKRSDRMREYLTKHDTSTVGDSITNAAFWLNNRVRGYRGSGGSAVWPLPNVWLGVSVEDQARADERIPDLLATPAAVRWLSCEPLLGPVDLQCAWHGENALDGECWGECNWCRRGPDFPPLHNCQAGLQSEAHWSKGRDGVDWIVAGGESGPGARPMHPDWARSLRDQCEEAGVPFFFKQWGEWAPVDDATPDGVPVADLMPDGTRVVHANPITAMLARVGKKRAGRLLDGVEHNGMPGRG